MNHGPTAWIRLLCPVEELRIGDEVFTPSWRWETVTALAAGDGYPRLTRVTTDKTGSEFPWQWRPGHQLRTRRPVVAPSAVAA
jgi:hypothetical protein